MSRVRDVGYKFKKLTCAKISGVQAVLLVEYDPSVRLLVGKLLSELGYRWTEPADAEAAIKLLEGGEHFDLFILDVGLPGILILFVTGYAENAAINRAGFLGTNMATTTKPFPVEDLAAKIGEMLS